MQKDEKVDFEKDYLIVYKNVNGHLVNWNWWQTDLTPEQVKQKILERNAKQNIESLTFNTAEMITDQLVREICAYKKKSEPLDDLINEIKEIQEGIEATKKFLKSALDSLNHIGAWE